MADQTVAYLQNHRWCAPPEGSGPHKQVDVRPAATAADLLDGITRFRPHVVHFSGHSNDDRAGEGDHKSDLCTVLSWVLILRTPDRGDAPAYHRSQWTTSSKGRRSGRRRGSSRRSAG